MVWSLRGICQQIALNSLDSEKNNPAPPSNPTFLTLSDYQEQIFLRNYQRVIQKGALKTPPYVQNNYLSLL